MSFKEVKSPVDFPELEKRILDFWNEHRIFEKTVESRPADKPFIFYEGPPTANGKPGIHHVISRTIKDFTCRYKTMQGFRVKRKAGWDTHGLPVEIEVEKALGFETKEQIEAYGVDKFNKKCRESVFTYLKEWNELTHRIGFWVDLDDAYITYKQEYIETVWHLLSQMWEKGLLYLGFKILPYCSRCETALSSHETSMGYKDVKDRSITAKFPLTEGENRFILAWTTTPWTLPGNVALAVGADIDYVEIEQNAGGRREIYYLAENRLEEVKGEYTVLRTLKGSEMEGWRYRPLFDGIDLSGEGERAYLVACADFVTTEEGTGVVHTAVMYGEDDYRLGRAIGLPAVHTVDEKGRFNDYVPLWTGRHVKDPDVEQGIIDTLLESGRLYRVKTYEHSYPHCWRCDSPLLYYAKKSWYLETTRIKERMIENNNSIRWIPKEVGEGRFGQWLENNIDWALSRDRFWGTPLNMWLCDGCDHKTSIGSVAELKERSGKETIEDLHKPYIDDITFPCPECGGTMRRTPEVIDCWFDSGAMPYAQFHYPFNTDGSFEEQFPADFIAEGIDQTRGWFYSLLAISTMISGTPAYKTCMSIEMILDKNGQKMSKSRGNSVDPFLILDKEGADPLRWYLFTVSPPWVPTRFDQEGVAEVHRKFFGTLANTYSFFVMYANIDAFAYETPIPVPERPEIDRWLISTANRLVQDVAGYLEQYEVTRAARQIQNFVLDDLSNWYVRRNRRRFWKAEMGPDKTAAFQTLYEVLIMTAKMVAPFAPFFAEDIYRNLNQNGYESAESVHLAMYPSPDDERYRYRDIALEERMNMAREIVTLSHSARNEAKIKVRQPLRRAIAVIPDREKIDSVRTLEPLILEEINMRSLEFVATPDEIMTQTALPVFKNLGPKFGKQVNQAAELVKAFTPAEIRRLQDGGSVEIAPDGAAPAAVTIDDIEVESRAAPGLMVQSGRLMHVAIDTGLDDVLINEGLTREFINRVQKMRKEAGFDVTDRIRVYYDADARMDTAIRGSRGYIQDELLAVELENNMKEAAYTKKWKIEDSDVSVSIEKVQ
ncbi:isoleucine--tRNA ligase [bacterium]|nr:isoleucine--tRNA ligase [bacterium]